MTALRLTFLVGLSGCTTAPNPKSCADDFCHDPALPFCDTDGSISGTPNTCVPVACTPNEFAGCRGDEVLTCNQSGTNYNVVPCEFGCNEAAGCNACIPGGENCGPHIIPAHVPEVCNALATLPAFTVSSTMTLDTDQDASCTGGVIDQGMGPDICVIRHQNITLTPSAKMTVKGTRALALVADYSLTIDGVLDVSADSLINGAGGGHTESGAAGVVPDGSGGAGLKTPGGNGGNDTSDGGASNGGSAAEMNPALVAELFGGTQSQQSSGGCGLRCGQPGGAGGALALVSCRGELVISGLIDAGGGGGDSGTDAADTTLVGPGGAGGSGGYVVLQGMVVTVVGELYANGGGGGAGSPSQRCEVGGAGCGADGSRSDTESARGGQAAFGGGAGGDGGREGSAPKPGWKRSMIDVQRTSGGGGGSTGFIQTYTPPGVSPTLTPRGVSPAFEPNLNAQIR